MTRRSNKLKFFNDYKEKLKSELADLRVIYTDLDGTLLNDRGCLVKDIDGNFFFEGVHLLKTISEKGWDLVLVSGRNKLQLRYNAMLVGVKNYIPELGCELVYDLGKKVHITFDISAYQYEITRGGKDLIRITSLLKSAFPGKIESKIEWSMERSYNALFFGEVNLTFANRILTENGYDGLVLVDNGFSKMMSADIDVENPRIYNLVPAGVEKSSAIKLDRKLRALDRKNCIALGDSAEDLKMAKEVHAFFLMRDAVEMDADMYSLAGNYENVYITNRRMNRGWAEVIKFLAH